VIVDASKELRASSDTLLDDLAMLAGLEQEKRALTPENPHLATVAREIERLAARVLGLSQRQRLLTEEVSEHAQASPVTTAPPSIEETPREIHLILADWRDAERRASEAQPGSPEAHVAWTDVDRFRAEYRAAHEYARRRRA
jgi:hypothetical protein